MRIIDPHTWERGAHFKVYNAFDYPHFSVCANVDLTEFLPHIRKQAISPTIAIIYLIARTANELPEFRRRIRGQQVVEHELVHPSTTILRQDDLFSFCTIPYTPDFSAFAALAQQRIAAVQDQLSMHDEPGQDDLLFMTAIPWISFTSFMHPIHLHPIDSVPRFAWGKFFSQGDRWMMPFSVQVHHALMDGLHVGRYYQLFQDYLLYPQRSLSAA